MVGCPRCTYPSIHIETPQDHGRLSDKHISEHSLFLLTKTLSRSRSVVWCVVWCVWCVVFCVCMWRVWCVGCVCTCGVCGVGGMWVVVLWWCVCVVCGEAWHTISLSCSLSFLFSFPFAFPFFFSLIFLFLSSFSFSFSLAPSLTLALALVLSLFLLSSLLATKHYGKNRSTNTAANIEAFECDLAQGKCTAVGSLPPPLPSVLPSHTPLLKKKMQFFITGIFPARNLHLITV